MLTRVLPIVPPDFGGAALVGIATAADRGLRSRLDFLRFFSFAGVGARFCRLSRFLLSRFGLRVPPGVLIALMRPVSAHTRNDCMVTPTRFAAAPPFTQTIQYLP